MHFCSDHEKHLDRHDVKWKLQTIYCKLTKTWKIQIIEDFRDFFCLVKIQYE